MLSITEFMMIAQQLALFASFLVVLFAYTFGVPVALGVLAFFGVRSLRNASSKTKAKSQNALA
ncbi:hypothetical protein ACI2KR_30460 [Pseudomonas luteola]